MFNDPGKKVKNLAEFILWFTMLLLGFIGFLIAKGLNANELFFIAVDILLGAVIGWLISITLYAFGEMVEDTHATREAVEKILKLEEDL